MKKILLIAASAVLSLAGFAQDPIPVSVFNYPGLNGAGGCDDENANLISIIGALPEYSVNGAIVNFTDSATLANQLDTSVFFFMTDMESGDPNSESFFPTASRTVFRNWVNDGGVMVMTGTYGTNDNDFLNNIFGWDLGRTTAGSWAKNDANTAGTPFEFVDVPSLPSPSATDAISKGTVDGFKPMWGTDSDATVATITYGSGTVIFMGYDFFNTGVGCPANGNDWVQKIIPAALEYAASLAQGAVVNITYTDAEFQYEFSEDGTTSFIVVPEGSTVPTDSQIAAGVDYSGVTVLLDSTLVTEKDSVYTFSLEGLAYGTSYDIYSLTHYYDGEDSTFSEIGEVNFSTTPNDAPVGNGISNQVGCLNDVFEGLSLTITDEFPGTDVFTVTVASSNTGLLPTDSIEVTGSGAARTISVYPTLETSGTSTVTVSIQDAEGETGTYNFDVTINNGYNSNNAVDTQQVCTGSYTWSNGVTYTESNYTDKDTLVSASGCDSIVTLHLTIAEPSFVIHTVSAAGDYTWLNGVTYSVDTFGPTHIIPNSVGCDSVITLDLTMEEYCTSRSTRNTFEWIKKVELEDDIDNLSNKNSGGFGDYTSDTLVVDTSDIVSVTLTPGYRRRVYTEYWRIWIDWNYDGDFDDAGEKVFEQKGKNVRTGSFTVPVNVSSEDLRMRVSMRWKRYATSCINYRNGEVEDYMVRVNGAQGYTGSISDGFPPLPTKMAEEEVVGNLYEISEIFPNPITQGGIVSGYIRVEETGVKDLLVVNTLGQVVKTVSVDCSSEENEFEISTDGLAKGLYFINMGVGSEAVKMIVK